MEFCLTIDRGNTALKAALWDSDGILVRHAACVDDTDAAALARSILISSESVCAVAYGSVVRDAGTADISALQTLGAPVLEVTAATPMPMKICYATPATLGVDRIAAAAGALMLTGRRPILVADIGTAVTYDLIDSRGRYIGGNIAPGISMRLKALHTYTSALPSASAEGSTPLWGVSTSEALRSGAIRGVAAELEYYRRAAGADAGVVITGGSASLLAKAGLLNFEHIIDPCLVHRGLYSILKHNEH